MSTEREVAANTVVLLIVHAIIDKRRWTAKQIADTLGLDVADLEAARRRHAADGLDSLLPRNTAGTTAQTEPVDTRKTERESRNVESDSRHTDDDAPASVARGDHVAAHPGERRCVRCGEWWPVEEFVEPMPDDPRPLEGFRRTMCRVCFGQFERGHFIAIKSAPKLFGEIRAYFTATRGDVVVDAHHVCEKCGKPIEEGQSVNVRGYVEHSRCPK